MEVNCLSTHKDRSTSRLQRRQTAPEKNRKREKEERVEKERNPVHLRQYLDFSMPRALLSVGC